MVFAKFNNESNIWDVKDSEMNDLESIDMANFDAQYQLVNGQPARICADGVWHYSFLSRGWDSFVEKDIDGSVVVHQLVTKMTNPDAEYGVIVPAGIAYGGVPELVVDTFRAVVHQNTPPEILEYAKCPFTEISTGRTVYSIEFAELVTRIS